MTGEQEHKVVLWVMGLCVLTVVVVTETGMCVKTHQNVYRPPQKRKVHFKMLTQVRLGAIMGAKIPD